MRGMRLVVSSRMALCLRRLDCERHTEELGQRSGSLWSHFYSSEVGFSNNFPLWWSRFTPMQYTVIKYRKFYWYDIRSPGSSVLLRTNWRIGRQKRTACFSSGSNRNLWYPILHDYGEKSFIFRSIAGRTVWKSSASTDRRMIFSNPRGRSQPLRNLLNIW